jgi:hypothetical protein
VRAKWRFSSFDHCEITINEVLGEVVRTSREARSELHSKKMYIMRTKRETYFLCSRCCKTLGLPLNS